MKATYVPLRGRQTDLTDDLVKSIRGATNDWWATFEMKDGVTKEELLKELGCTPLLIGDRVGYEGCCITLPGEWFMVMARCGGELILECEKGSVKVVY
jgi:hypothetical protein